MLNRARTKKNNFELVPTCSPLIRENINFNNFKLPIPFKITITHFGNILKDNLNFFNSIKPKIKHIIFNQYEFFFKVNKNKLNNLLEFCSNHSLSRQDLITDIAAYDKPGKPFRFSVLYNTLSVNYNNRILWSIKTKTVEPIETITNIFKGANWYEREVWDLFGIFVQNHPDLRRILTDYGFRGYPLRKDFPVTGFVDLLYKDTHKSIKREKISLAQEMREFTIK